MDERVCCMCGDVGFPDKIFRCINCHNRFQHSYCSNYYKEKESSDRPELCDWCHSDSDPHHHHIQIQTSKLGAASSKKPRPTRSNQHGSHKSPTGPRTSTPRGQVPRLKVYNGPSISLLITLSKPDLIAVNWANQIGTPNYQVPYK